MAEPLSIEMIPPTFVEGFCPSGPQDFANKLAEGSTFVGTVDTRWIVQEAEPSATQRTQPDGSPNFWFKPSIGQWFVWTAVYGKWTRRRIPYSTGDRRFVLLAAEADVWAYDGGDGSDPSSSAPTATTGAMWEVDEDMEGRFALGAGTIPTSDPAVTVAPLATQDSAGVEGTYAVELDATNLPEHKHQVAIGDAHNFLTIPDAVGRFEAESDSGSATWIDWNNGLSTTKGGETRAAGQASDAILPVNKMPPYRAGFWIKPTARTHYTSDSPP